MGRLAGTICYEIGAMDRVVDGGVGWRRELTPWLQKRGVFVLDPSNKPIKNTPNEFDGRLNINEWKQNGEFDKIRPAYADSIRGLDCRMVDWASFIYCYLDIDASPCGTYEEWFLANRQKKPIITVCAQGKKGVPNWLLLAMPHEFFFSSHDEAKEYLDYVDTHDGEIETFNRWRFFDWQRIVRETTEQYGSF